MRERSRGARVALAVVLAVLALLLVVNGIILLCETDPQRFYSNLFGVAPAATSTVEP